LFLILYYIEMAAEDILLESAAEVENEYENEFEDFEDEGGGSMSLKQAAQVVDKESEFDARESLKSASRVQLQPPASASAVNSPRYQDDYDESIEDKLRKADAKTDVIPNTEEKPEETPEEKMEDTESEYGSDDDDDDDEYEDAKDFLFCCYRRKVSEVIRHLERGASLSAPDRHGWTPLHWACAKGHDEVLEALLKEGHRRGNNNNNYNNSVRKCVNRRDALMGFTPLHLACVGGHVECVRLLLCDHSAKRLKNNIGELPIDVLGVDIGSAPGRKIAKLFGIVVPTNTRRADGQQDDAKLSRGGENYARTSHGSRK
jgi:hypothetical protein